MTSLNSRGSKVKLVLFRGGQRVEGGGVGEGVKARQENAHCDGKVLGDKGGNGLSLALR